MNDEFSMMIMKKAKYNKLISMGKKKPPRFPEEAKEKILLLDFNLNVNSHCRFNIE